MALRHLRVQYEFYFHRRELQRLHTMLMVLCLFLQMVVTFCPTPQLRPLWEQLNKRSSQGI